MKELKCNYYKGTKSYTQINQSLNAFMYEVADTETGHVYYEVFERKYNRRFNCISYPSDKAFGKWAWCISRGDDYKKAFDSAMKRFDFLSEQRQVA